MCGIAGWMGPSAEGMGCREARAVLDILEHRGPDDWGWFTASGEGVRSGKHLPEDFSGPVQFLHRRLAILDLSEAARQPMSSQCGRFHICFNGEIFNFIELRAELEREGRTFHTLSDTEVLLEGYAQWGQDLFRRLIGMFAIALWDQAERRMILVRDPFGIKPLFWMPWRGGVAFASEIKALMALPGADRRVDPQSLCDFLRFSTTDHRPDTLFSSVKSLRPAQMMTWDARNPGAGLKDLGRFWAFSLDREIDISFDEAAERLRDLFLESVRMHLRSDVPVGAALSGGIDSSAIVMAMRQLEPNLELHTFTFQSDDPSVDETAWAEMVSSAARAHTHRVRPGVRELSEDLPALIASQDEPFGSMSIHAQYCVFRLAKEHGITVMLDGQGADEMLGGYPIFSAARVASLVRSGQWGKAAALLYRASRLPGRSRLPLMTGPFLLPEAIQAPFRKLVGEEIWPGWVNREWFSSRGILPRARYAPGQGTRFLKDQLGRALGESSLPMLLRYEDKNSMAHSIESRVPFLTTRLVDFVFSLPESHIVSDDGTTKAVFRKAMRGLVPGPILDRRDKIGFQAPALPWLKALQPLIEAKLNSEAARSMPFLRLGAMHGEWRDMIEGRRPFDFRPWRWLTLLGWVERTQPDFSV